MFACGVISEPISTAGKLKNMPDHGWNRTYDLWNASLRLCKIRGQVIEVHITLTTFYIYNRIFV